MAVRSLLDRLRALDPRVRDALLGVLVGVEGAAEVIPIPLTAAQRLGGLAAIALLAGGAFLRRRAPLAAGLLVYATLVTATFDQHVDSHTLGPFFIALLLLADIGGRVEEARFRVLVAGGVLTGLEAAVVDSGGDGVVGSILSIALLIGPLYVGRFLRGRAELNEALRRRTAQLAHDSEARSRRAVVEERTRIAEELHDVVAHALTAMVVQASATRRLVEHDPELARAGFATVEGAGREALAEMRRLLGVLRREDADLAFAPQPGLAHVATLVHRARDGGLPVALDVRGVAAPLSPGLDVAAYRVIQEALGGAIAQGDAQAAEVHVRYGADALEIEVLDDGGIPPGGRPLLGVRERVAVYGGDLAVGARAGHGHALQARLPLGAGA